MYEFHLRPRGSNGTVVVCLSVIVWPVHSTQRAVVLVPLAGPSLLPGSPRASDFPFKKKQCSVSKKWKFRFDSVSLLPKLNSMKSQYIKKSIPLNLNYHWIKI